MDRIPTKVIIGGLVVVISLVLIFNFGLREHQDHEADLAKRFDVKQVKELMKPHVTISHRELVEQKLKIIRNGGRNHLQLIIDFDKTLAKYRDEKGNLVKSTHEVFSRVETVPDSFRQDSGSLYSMYGPIESDPSISVEDKIPFMEQWIHEYGMLIEGIPMNTSLIQRAVNKTHLVMRDGAREMLLKLQDASVPVLIFSAGIGDVIKAALEVNHVNLSNVHTISNFFSYNKGKITGFKGKYIHAFNKNQRVLQQIDFKYAKDLTGRSSVILLGDSLGDAFMADGLPSNTTILRIGFLNNKIEENLPYFKEMFDIVTTNDETMNITNAILQRVLYHLL